MTTTRELTEGQAQALRASVRGAVTTPADPGWDDARRAWNLSVDQRPAAVVEAADADDVAEVVRHAGRAGLRVAPQGTGHGAEGRGSLAGALLLKTTALDAIDVDPGTGIARLGAGVTAGAAADAAGAHGRAPVLGLASTVGVTGLTLGGGSGWLSRTHGLAASNARAFEVVTADGERRRVDAEHEPDLFWALRGGGGAHAIVTALEVATHPVRELSAGALIWPVERAAEVLERFRGWAAEAPESLGAVLRYLSVPPIEAAPPPLRGRRVVAVAAANLGPEDDGARLVAPLRELGGTIIDSFGPVPPPALVRVAGDPEDPSPARGRGFLLDELAAGVTDTLAELIEADALAPLVMVELRLLGGAMAREPEGGGALVRLAAPFSVFTTGAVLELGMVAAIDERLAFVRERLAPWRSEKALLGAELAGTDPATAFDAATWERLVRVRDAYDPERRFLASFDA